VYGRHLANTIERRVFVDSLYQLLMELSSSSSVIVQGVSAREGVEAECGGSVSALACCCLLSLVIARGDTGKLLTTVAAMLMYSTRLAAQHIMVPLPVLLLLYPASSNTQLSNSNKHET